MGANVEAVEPHVLVGEQCREPVIDLLQPVRREESTPHVRLIREHDEPQAGRTQIAQRRRGAGDEGHLVGVVEVVDLLVDRPVPVEQHEPPGHRREGLQTASPTSASTPVGVNANEANVPPRRSSAARTSGWRSSGQYTRR